MVETKLSDLGEVAWTAPREQLEDELREINLDLFAAAIELRMAFNGAADPINPERALMITRVLRHRLQNWAPSSPAGNHYADSGARQFLSGVLREVCNC